MKQAPERFLIVRGTSPQQYLARRGRKWVWSPRLIHAYIAHGQRAAVRMAEKVKGTPEPITPETDIERARQEAAFTAAIVIWEASEVGRFADVGDTNPLGPLIIEFAREMREEFFRQAGPFVDEWLAASRERTGMDLPPRLAHSADIAEAPGDDDE